MVFPQCRKLEANPQRTYKPEKHVNQPFMTVKVRKETDRCQKKAYSISLFSLEVSDTLLSLGAFGFKSHQHGVNESFEEHPLVKTFP